MCIIGCLFFSVLDFRCSLSFLDDFFQEPFDFVLRVLPTSSSEVEVVSDRHSEVSPSIFRSGSKISKRFELICNSNTRHNLENYLDFYVGYSAFLGACPFSLLIFVDPFLFLTISSENLSVFF